MTDSFEPVRGSGNVFSDLGLPNPELEQFRAMLAAQIIKTLDSRKWTVRKAAEETGIAAADFSRIRNVRLDRFTIDRLMTILGHLGQEVQLSTVRPRMNKAVAQTAAINGRAGAGGRDDRLRDCVLHTTQTRSQTTIP